MANTNETMLHLMVDLATKGGKQFSATDFVLTRIGDLPK